MKCITCPDEATEFFGPTGLPTTRGRCLRCLEQAIRTRDYDLDDFARSSRRVNKKVSETKGRKALSTETIAGAPDMRPTGEDEDEDEE